MTIEPMQIKVKDLCKNYTDDGDGGVYGYDGKLTIRPEYQREFVYKDNQRDAVIDTVFRGFPLNVMYWNKLSDDKFEVLDGQQRTISLGQYLNGDFSVNINGNNKYFHNLTETEKKRITDYELTVYLCEGTQEEKLDWFRVINIAGEVLTPQELLNATYAGPWLSDAKNYFSKRNCVAGQMADGFIKGNPIRQDYLEKALKWIADRDNLEDGAAYMAIHQHDTDANDLWLYFQTVINWAKMLFPNIHAKYTETQDWGILYNKYHNNTYNVTELKTLVDKLARDDDVTKLQGIVPYALSKRTKHDEKLLSIRAFTENMKMRVYEKQNHKCIMCGQTFEFSEMEGDHIVPWSKGGKSTEDNCQMLCQTCNNDKSDK